MTNDIIYRLIDACNGAVMVLLLVFAARLLLVRREGPLRVRSLGGLFLLLSFAQTLVYFLLEEDERISIALSEQIALWTDLLAALSGLGLIWVLYRNRHLYGRRTVNAAGGLLLLQWCSYGLCAALQFADWTYMLYLPLSGLVWCGIGWLLDRSRPTEPTPTQEESHPKTDAFLEQLDAVLKEDRYFCSEDITRDEVCRRMLTNRTTFSQRLSESVDMTFTEYLREMRLREAARLLRETDIPINQVAFEVGLHSASGFHRNFLLSYGMTPKQYREKTDEKAVF